MRPDPVEAVDIGGAQDLPAEAHAPGRGRAVGVGPEQQGEQAAGRLGVGVAAGDRGLDGGQAGEAALQGPPGDHQGVAGGQGEQDLQAPGGRLEGGAGRAEQPLAPAREELLEGLGVGHVHRLEPVHHPGGVGLGLEGDVVHHPAQLLGQPGHAGEQALAGHLMAGQPEPQLVAGQVGRLLELGDVLGDQQHLGRVGGRHGQLVLAEHGAGELADQGADLEAGDQAADPADHVADPGRPMPAPVPRASATRRAPGSTRGAKPPRTASAQSGRFTGLAARATPGAGRLVTGSTQSSARRRRSSQDRASPGSGAAAGLGSWGIMPRSSAPAAVATATCRASSQFTGPLAVAISLANSRNNGIRRRNRLAARPFGHAPMLLAAQRQVGQNLAACG